MTTVFIRTCIIYLVLIGVMRLMGKRQIGELEVSDLVTTILISEIASLPITNTAVPMSHAIIPTVTLLAFEVISSLLIAKFPKVKSILTARPSMLIKKGSFCKKAMLDARISTDELIGELRQQGITDPNEVLYAILEQNGKLSLITEDKKDSMAHPIIVDGKLDEDYLRKLGYNEGWLSGVLREKNVSLDETFLLTVSDNGDINVIKKEEKCSKA